MSESNCVLQAVVALVAGGLLGAAVFSLKEETQGRKTKRYRKAELEVKNRRMGHDMLLEQLVTGGTWIVYDKDPMLGMQVGTKSGVEQEVKRMKEEGLIPKVIKLVAVPEGPGKREKRR